MKNLLTIIALLFTTCMVAQTTFWAVYNFQAKPGTSGSVVQAFDRFFDSETGKALPNASLSAVLFSNSKTTFSHRIAFWSDDKDEFAKLYSGMMQQSSDMEILGMHLDKSIKPVSSVLGKAVMSGTSAGKNYRTIYQMAVSDPATYASAFSVLQSELIEASGGKLGLDLHQIISGGEKGATHVVVSSAASFADLLEMTDMVFASDAYKAFAAKVKNVREIQNIYTLVQAKQYNVE